MPISFGTSSAARPKDEDVVALIAARKYTRAIEVLRTQLAKRGANPTLRMQLADVLLLAEKRSEAIALLLPLADQYASDGFAAKAISVLKKIQKVDPGRRDVQQRLAQLIEEKQREAVRPVTRDLPGRAAASPAVEAGPDLEIGLSMAPISVSASPQVTGPQPASPPARPAPAKAPAVEAATGFALLPAQPGRAPAGQGRTVARAAPPLATREPSPDATLPYSAAGAVVAPAPVAPPERPSLTAEPFVSPELPALAAEPIEDGAPIVEGQPLELERAGANAPAPDWSGGLRLTDLDLELSPLPGGAEAPRGPNDSGSGPAVEDYDLLGPDDSDPLLAEAAPLEIEPAMIESSAAELSPGQFTDELMSLVDTMFQEPPAAPASGPGAAAAPAQAGTQIVVSPLFRDFSVDEMVAVIEGLKLQVFERGEVVLRQGDPGASLYMLTSGRVRAFRKDRRTGRQVALGDVREGAFFGEMSILTGAPRTATIVALRRSELLELDRPTLDQITVTHPHVWDVLREFAARRVAEYGSPASEDASS